MHTTKTSMVHSDKEYYAHEGEQSTDMSNMNTTLKHMLSKKLQIQINTY